MKSQVFPILHKMRNKVNMEKREIKKHTFISISSIGVEVYGILYQGSIKQSVASKFFDTTIIRKLSGLR